MYKVKEIFKSIQGEGFYSGMTAVFVGVFRMQFMEWKKVTKIKPFVNFVTLTFLVLMVKMVEFTV